MKMKHITFDCEDAGTLARFWADVLGWGVGPDASEDFAAVGGPSRPADTPAMLFLKVPEGKSAKNRVHVDLESDDLEADLDRIVALGATTVHEKNEYGTHWFTLTDPEGNEFCVSDLH